MEQKKYSPLSILKIVLGVIFGAWLIMSAPTGWIYDLWAGTGTEQGQMPDQSSKHSSYGIQRQLNSMPTPTSA